MSDDNEELLDREDKLARIQVIKEQQRQLTEEYERLREEATPDADEYVLITGYDGQKYRVTRVEGSTSSFDMQALRDLVPDEVFNEVTKPVVDTDKFKQAVQAKRITPAVVVQVLKMKPKASYPKYEPVEYD